MYMYSRSWNGAHQTLPERNYAMATFAAPAALGFPTPSGGTSPAARARSPQMTLGRRLRAAAAAGLAAAAVHAAGGADAVALSLGVHGLGEQAVPVLVASSEALGTARLPAHWEVRSYGCATATYVVVANESAAPVDLLWVDYKGEEVQYATIAPGKLVMQPSYASHPWVVRDHMSQNSLLFVMAERDPAFAVVSGEGEDARARQAALLDDPVAVTLRRAAVEDGMFGR